MPSVSVLDRLPLRVLVGPTGSGKTGLGVELALRAGSAGVPLEVVALDSMTVYRGLDVGTAKPTPAERRGVPHHLLDVADPEERFDLKAYLGLVEAALEGMEARGVQPLFVGGTGLYLAALLRGLFDGPPVDLELRARLEAAVARDGAEALRARLLEVDPEAHRRIHPGDLRRTIRALEVFEQTGTPLSRLQAQWRRERRPREERAHVAGLRLPTAELDRRIRARTEAMLAAGWPEEARALEARGALGPSAVQALGYGAAAALGRGEADLAPTADEIALRTRQFARRQRTWFGRFDITWVDPRDGDALDHLARALRLP